VFLSNDILPNDGIRHSEYRSAQGVGDIGPRLGQHLNSTLIRGRHFQNTDHIILLGAATFDFALFTIFA